MTHSSSYSTRAEFERFDCTNLKQFPVVHCSLQHKCYYLNTSSLVSSHGSHSRCVFNAELSGSSVQSISAAELLKQQKTLHRQRFQARQKRAEEIQKRCVCMYVCACYGEWMMDRIKYLNYWTDFFFLRVLQNTGGAGIPARPSINRAALPSSKAASEAHKSSSPPKPDLSVPPVPTLGRGYTEGEDILLDMSPPPCSKSISAAKVGAPFVTENKIRQAAWYVNQNIYNSFWLVLY